MKKKSPVTKSAIEIQRWSSKSFTWVKVKESSSEKIKGAPSFEGWSIHQPHTDKS